MKKNDNTVLWWIGWILLTIITFFISCYFWTGWIARHVGPMDQKGAAIVWVSAVFGTWMVLLVPLIVVMYSKVDKTYEDARIVRETMAAKKAPIDFPARSILVEEEKRRLTPELVAKIKQIPETMRHGHLVNVKLNDGRRIENVFVLKKKEVLGVYDRATLDFDIQSIAEIEPSDPEHLPAFETERWLRLDGAGVVSNG